MTKISLLHIALMLTISYTCAHVPAIGDNYQGGKVGYILQPGDPGYDTTKIKALVVGASGNTNKQCCLQAPRNTFTNVNSASIGSGASNISVLSKLIGAGDHNAYQTDALRTNGYSDCLLSGHQLVNNTHKYIF